MMMRVVSNSLTGKFAYGNKPFIPNQGKSLSNLEQGRKWTAVWERFGGFRYCESIAVEQLGETVFVSSNLNDSSIVECETDLVVVVFFWTMR